MKKIRKILFNNKKISIILLSLMGGWIICFPYNGNILYLIAEDAGAEGNTLLYISLILQVVGLILGGLFVSKKTNARSILLTMMPVNIICVAAFLFPIYKIWVFSIAIMSMLAGICISATGHFIQNQITYENRYRTAAELLINMFIIKLIVDNISQYISMQIGIASIMLIMLITWFISFKIPYTETSQVTMEPDKAMKKKALLLLLLLFLFVATFSIDFGIMVQAINPKYTSISWLTSWYWIFPYVSAAFIMRQIKNSDDRRSLLYTAVGMIGFGFIIFLLLDYSITSYLIVTTVMMGAWAIFDVFWWSMLGEMIEMVKSPAKIMSVGFSAIMLGLLLGKFIASNNPTIAESNLSIISMAVICVTLMILPLLHRLLSVILKNKTQDFEIEKTEAENINFIGIRDALTEREKQIAALLLKGRTCKLIASELFLSENTVKTHIKNIYSKMGIQKKSEFFNAMQK